MIPGTIVQLFLDIPSSYAKILGGNLFQPREFLRSWWKAEGVERKRKKEEKNGARKHTWTKSNIYVELDVHGCLTHTSPRRAFTHKYSDTCVSSKAQYQLYPFRQLIVLQPTYHKHLFETLAIATTKKWNKKKLKNLYIIYLLSDHGHSNGPNVTA